LADFYPFPEVKDLQGVSTLLVIFVKPLRGFEDEKMLI